MGWLLWPLPSSPGRLTTLVCSTHELVSKIPSDRKALKPKAVIPSPRQIRSKDGSVNGTHLPSPSPGGVRQTEGVCVYSGGQDSLAASSSIYAFLNTQLQGGHSSSGWNEDTPLPVASHSSLRALHPVLLEATCQAGQVHA